MTARKRTTPLALAAATLSLALSVAGCGDSSPPPSKVDTSANAVGSTGGESGLEGAVLPPGTPAPGFTLIDQQHQRVSLRALRGRVTVIAFLYSTCGATCVLIAQQIRGALNELEGEHARLPAVLIVSADPTADTRANVGRFLREVSLTGRVRFLTASTVQLRPIWRAYRIRPASAGRTKFAEYTSVLLLDTHGNERALFQSEQLTPESISHDIRRLDSR